MASAIKALRPEVKIFGVEPETAAPAALSFEKGSPQEFPNWKSSFVDGAGGQSMFPRMWERMKPIVDGCLVVTLEDTKNAMRLLAEKARVIAEGAGAMPVAAALEWESWQRADRRDRVRWQYRSAKILRIDLAKRLLTFAPAI